MTSKTVDELYEAFESADVAKLLATLHPALVLTVSEGMPLGVGGVHHGPEAALRDCWGVVFGVYDTRPVPEEQVWSGADRVVVLGHYRGLVRATGRPYAARFAHDLVLREGLVAGFTQITDTERWAEALNESTT